MFRKDTLKIIAQFHLFCPLSGMNPFFTKHICSCVWIVLHTDLSGPCGYCWPPVPLKAKVEHYIIWIDNTLFSFPSDSKLPQPPQCLYEHRCHFNRGRADVTRKWPVGEPKSRWGLSVFNLKLVSGLRNGWYNHICSWTPINSASSHRMAVVGQYEIKNSHAGLRAPG